MSVLVEGNNVFKNSLLNKEEEFLNSDFEFRLQCVQSLLKNNEVDGLLLVNGADGARNPESAMLTNYLFQGYSGHEIFRNTNLDFDFEESMIMITPDGLEIFLEAKGFNKVRTAIMALQNPYVFVPPPEIQDNQDLFERVKIREFYRMIYSKPTIGVVLPQNNNKGIMAVENWPISKTYAIDGIGGGFITSMHKVRDLGPHVSGLYMRFDLMPKKSIINQVSKRLVNNSELLMKQLDNFKQKNKAEDLDQEKFSELFTETFEMGELNRATILKHTPISKIGITLGVA